ncbi:MAG: hypothetical protein ACJAX1_002738 [Neolewinella sp.]
MQVIVGGVVMPTVHLTTSKVLPTVIRNNPMGQPILYEAVENAVNGHPIHWLFQLCRNPVVAQSVGLLLQQVQNGGL